jgi:hypothetical protein|tara:strand:+ start:694 stop:999 length:306 start_codon:yes stop_codon:yes gene_type:complete
MFSTKYSAPDPKVHKPYHMSYMFGPHMPESSNGIYFGGDNRIVRLEASKIPVQRGSQPAWLIADWILAMKRGEPISEYAQSVIAGAVSKSKSLEWLWNLET